MTDTFYTEDTARTNRSHAECYAKGLHDASKAGRAECRRVYRFAIEFLQNTPNLYIPLPTMKSLLPDILAKNETVEDADRTIDA